MRLSEHLDLQRKALIRKGLVPKHTIGFFTNENMKKAELDYLTDPIKERVCPVCGICIRAPDQWFRQHTKIHSSRMREADKLRDGDIHKLDAKVYFS